jgi:crotonobetainyl-CoA:carnitine CoA-transferase CaiB-like acyl-CoA transferase
MERLEAEDVPHTPVYNMQEVFQDPQIKHMGLEITLERKDKPHIRTVAFPNIYSETRNPHPLPPPELGEHNAEYLKRLGYSDQQIAEFKEKGIL